MHWNDIPGQKENSTQMLRHEYDLQMARAYGVARVAERHWRQYCPDYYDDLARERRLAKKLMKVTRDVQNDIDEALKQVRENPAHRAKSYMEREKELMSVRENAYQEALRNHVLFGSETAG